MTGMTLSNRGMPGKGFLGDCEMKIAINAFLFWTGVVFFFDKGGFCGRFDTKGTAMNGYAWMRRMAAVLVCGGWAQAAELPDYKNAALPVDRRVADLLGRMTLDEKIQQLRGYWQVEEQIMTNGVFDAAMAAPLLANGIGEWGPLRWETGKEVAMRNAIQRYLLERTRLGIPVIFHDEGCHGLLAPGATSFPAPIGLACSWDPELAEQIFGVVAGEMRSRGIHHALTPVVDVCRDPRWGRTDETLGEDPYFNGKMGAAMVRGLQGGADGLVRPGHVAATLKHLAGHGHPQGGVNRAPADIPPRELRDVHLVPFRMALAESKPVSVMPSYNELDGLPSHANVALLQGILRGEWGFDGLIASDYEGVEYLASVHGLAADNAEAAALALRTGVEINLPKGEAFARLRPLVLSGRVPVALVDRAVGRVLRLKFQMGLFENPYADATAAVALSRLASSRTLALEAARRSIVLLKNRDGLLPLDKQAARTIAVVGPNAVQARLGSYSGEPWQTVGLLAGIRAKVGASVKVVHAEGCRLIANLPEQPRQAWETLNLIEPVPAEVNRALREEAVAVAAQADLIVLALGENEALCREAWAPTHIGDSTTLALFGEQEALARAMFALGKPVIVYLMNGRPLAIPEIAERADAVIEGWYMGQETGTAAADILFGDVNPSGKLTITFPRTVGQVPAYYNHKPGARLFDYVDTPVSPLYPFGFGLSYTTFSYGEPALAANRIAKDGATRVSVVVTNTGKRAGDEIVQLYIRDPAASVTRPVKALKGFARISLAPGESKTVTFDVGREQLAFHGVDLAEIVEPGTIEVWVGPSSVALKKAVLTVTE